MRKIKNCYAKKKMTIRKYDFLVNRNRVDIEDELSSLFYNRRGGGVFCLGTTIGLKLEYIRRIK